MKIMLIAGDAAGDASGAELAEAVLQAAPQARLFGMGGALMKEAGVRLLFNPTTMTALGLLEGVKKGNIMRRVLLRLGEVMAKQDPKVVVLIDFPQFNVKLGQMAKAKGIPVLFYLSPASWPNARARPGKLLEAATKIVTVFPFDVDPYQQAGADIDHVGHPLLDQVPPANSPTEGVVCLCPGNTLEDMRRNLPSLLKGALKVKKAREEVDFVLPLPPNIPRDDLDRILKGDGTIKVQPGRQLDVLGRAELAVCDCGAPALEAAYAGVPLIAVYNSPLFCVEKLWRRPGFMSLPNVLAGRQVVPEYCLGEMGSGRLAEEIETLLDDEKRRGAMAADLGSVIERLGPPGALTRMAGAILELAGRGRT
ncbi:MAG: hypothetical protein GX182_09825 [Firmicutes bacterium]|jgi:lipid-A-disaccharide synthase|nr:hypothetical protein [Bacillota bacterium]